MYRCEVSSYTTSLPSLKLFYYLVLHGCLPIIGLPPIIKRFTLNRSPLGNSTSKDQYERKDYHSYCFLETHEYAKVLAFLSVVNSLPWLRSKIKLKSRVG
uniref:Ribosomal protein S10 n=1 Tax=Phaeophyceae sp. TaxID=2249243 RepID=A0A8E8U519_9PHAE|nr:ribosomal protein S10 [Phaeophyceae sp.]